MPSDPRDRVARKLLHTQQNDGRNVVEVSEDYVWDAQFDDGREEARREADAAIAEYNAYLWERAADPAVVEAVQNAILHDARLHPQSYTTEMSARCSITATLTALIGPKPEENDDER